MQPERNMILSDIGEFRLLNEFILPLLKTESNLIGDDCAFVDFPLDGKSIVITTDAGPKPLFHNEEKPYFFIWGWYTILANVSDLASAGCKPLGVSLAVEAPATMKVDELIDYFNGVNAACKEFGIQVTGGNIKANTQFISNATAFGYIQKGQSALTRRNCKPGDHIVSLGDNGLFIVSYLKYKKDGFDSLSPQQKNKLKGPYPQIEQMQLISNKVSISSSSDNSDGILGSLWNIAEKSNCGFNLDFDSIELPEYIISFAKENDINPWNLFLFWGDWQIIFTVPSTEINLLKEICETNNIKYTLIGTAIKEQILTSTINGASKKLNLLRNENFSSLSYNSSISNHLDYLLRTNIFKNE